MKKLSIESSNPIQNKRRPKMAEFSITLDERKNRIYVNLEGFQTLDEVLKFKEEYRKVLAKCRPGFTVLTYARNYKPSTPEVQKIHAEAIEMDKAAGVRKVARVVGKTPLGGMQLNRLSRTVDKKYPAKNFETEEEAEAYLDSETD